MYTDYSRQLINFSSQNGSGYSGDPHTTVQNTGHELKFLFLGYLKTWLCIGVSTRRYLVVRIIPPNRRNRHRTITGTSKGYGVYHPQNNDGFAPSPLICITIPAIGKRIKIAMVSAHPDERTISGSRADWVKQLVTKDDPFHVHKTLGTLCLASYAIRFSQFSPKESDMAFGTYPVYTLPTLMLHMLLNLSSFKFKIPPKRISSGYRIWPEYRIHSLIFLMRSLASMGLTWYESTYNLPPDYRWNLVIVLATMAAADYGSHISGHRSGFARQLDVQPAVKYFFSGMQFGATAISLHGIRRFSLHYIFCMIIQCNAFLMTIRRKNLATHNVLVGLYGIMLITGFLLANIELIRHPLQQLFLIASSSALATSIRLGPKVTFLKPLQNKYILWSVIWCLMQMVRRVESSVDGDRMLLSLGVFFLLTHVSVVLVGVHYCRAAETGTCTEVNKRTN